MSATSSTQPKIDRTPTLHSQSVPPADACYLTQLKDKVCDIIQSRWGVVAAVGLGIGLATANVVLGAAALGVGSLAAWYFTANPEVTEGLLVACGNIGGLLSGFDEYVGDYGPQINGVKAEVSELISGKSTGCKPQTAENIQADLNHGPTLGQLITAPELDEMIYMAAKNGFNVENMMAVKPFFEKYATSRIFYALRRLPTPLTSIDKTLRDRAKETPEGFTLGILSSPAPMIVENALTRALLTPEVLACAENAASMKKKLTTWQDTKPQFVRAALAGLQACLGNNVTATLEDFAPFQTPEGQVFLYLIYQRTNTRILTTHKPGFIDAINRTKRAFAASALGNPELRAQTFLQKVKNSSVFFTQECDVALRQTFESSHFVSTANQISSDGSFIFLNKNDWENKYEVLLNDGEGKAVKIIATRKGVDQRAYLASIHGSAKDANHARTLISEIYADFVERAKKDPTLQLIIGVDANSNTPKDEADLLQLLNQLGLHAAEILVTTTKQRDVSIQHDKVGEEVVARKDYIITLKSHAFKDLTTAFEARPLSKDTKLPTIGMPSDHATIGARIVPIVPVRV